MRRALATLALILLACGEPPEPARYAPATRTRASWLLDPPELFLGDVGVLELAVVTPPRHTPHPYEPPEAPAGFWVLETQQVPVVKHSSQWVHRALVRVRAREVGRFVWPALALEVERPDGGIESVSVEAFPIDVLSSLPEHASRHSPYGVRDLVTSRGDRGSLALAFGSGAGLVLALLGLVALARRRRASARAAPPEPEGPSPWETARDAVARARTAIETEPVVALDELSIALRRYAAQRFGGASHARTTPELEDTSPPFTLTTRWPAFLGLLRDLDTARFPPPDDTTRSACEALAERAAAFVEETAPRDAG